MNKNENFQNDNVFQLRVNFSMKYIGRNYVELNESKGQGWLIVKFINENLLLEYEI